MHNIPKYNQLHLIISFICILSDNIIHMYIFRTDELVLDNQLCALPWRRLFLPLSVCLGFLNFFVEGEGFLGIFPSNLAFLLVLYFTC